MNTNTHMLDDGELQELKKRGFLVKENHSYYEFLFNVLFGSFILSCALFFVIFVIVILMFLWGFFFTLNIHFDSTFYIGIILLPFLLSLPILFGYIRYYIKTGVTFFSDTGVMELGEIVSTKNYILNMLNRSMQKRRAFFLLPVIIILIFLSYFVLRVFFYVYIIFFIIITVLIVSARRIYQLFFPIYAFGILGGKIQKIHTSMDQKIVSIKANFRYDIHFGFLSREFTFISTSFTKLNSYILKLENIETRLDKGNLFDSKKYINSFQIDIWSLLNEVKVFLEKQKNNIEQMQIQMNQTEIVDNYTHFLITTKRMSMLQEELRENINKIDGMMGKISINM
ncbi:hypothetical protein KBB25_00345 [Candidatus Gracilibacteria bacterium]|nr:hypothetical protein [Candidatus Gracilibacteria bacterium]